MSSTVEIMTEEELARARFEDDDAGFGALNTERGPLPLEAMDVRTRIAGLVAWTSLTQTFVNNLGEPMEATYIFPLPDRTAVTSFQMEVAGRIVHGIIKERGQARADYTAAIERGHRASIAEEERPGVFTIRVGNVMPREHATVRLTMTGPVPFDEGEATFRFPLVVAPRYIPGTPLGGADVGSGVANDTDAVPDASRITPPVLLPGYPNPVRLTMSVAMDVPLSTVRSSLHALRGADGLLELYTGERLNRDFILRWPAADESIRTKLVVCPDRDGHESTFMLTMTPPLSLSRSDKPRDVVFVLDRSGSMGGWKMVAARRAVGRMVDTLSDKDRFTVMAFDNSIETPRGLEALPNATDRNRFRAVEFLANIDARGGTEMAQPLERAATLLGGGYRDRERVIVLVTDGQVGNEDQILRMLGDKAQGTRIFCVGIDRSVNGAFLQRMASQSGGVSELVESEDRLDEVMDRVHRRIGSPVLTELSLLPSGLELDRSSIAPARLPDLFAGAPVVISGRCRGPTSGHVELTGADKNGRHWSQQIVAELTNNDAITSVWARARVRDLEDRYVVQRSPGLEKQIVDVSVRFSVLCRFTAFVAVDHEERVNPGGNVREITQPVDAPEGWAMFRGPGSGGANVNRTQPGMAVKSTSMSKRKPSRRVQAEASMPEERMRGITLGDSLHDDAMEMDECVVAAPYDRPVPAPAPRGAPKPEPRRDREQKEKKEAPVDLTVFQQRVRELIERVAKVALASEAMVLLKTELPRLLVDMQNAGVAHGALEALRQVLAMGETSDDYDRAIKALERFAGPAPRASFWR